MDVIRDTTSMLIAKCKAMVDEESRVNGTLDFDEEDYMNEADPSILRFLIASREEVTSTQLRDDLLSMLVAGALSNQLGASGRQSERNPSHEVHCWGAAGMQATQACR